jgi:hypothetical protein
VRVFAAGQERDLPVKVVDLVYWRSSGATMPLKLVLIKPLGYRLRKGSKLLYRQPAFLICTDDTAYHERPKAVSLRAKSCQRSYHKSRERPAP